MPKVSKKDISDPWGRRTNERRELDQLMRKCCCEKFSGGRGSGIGYVHTETKRILQFDQPHPGNELYKYQIEKVIKFLQDIGELEKR